MADSVGVNRGGLRIYLALVGAVVAVCTCCVWLLPTGDAKNDSGAGAFVVALSLLFCGAFYAAVVVLKDRRWPAGSRMVSRASAVLIMVGTTECIAYFVIFDMANLTDVEDIGKSTVGKIGLALFFTGLMVLLSGVAISSWSQRLVFRHKVDPAQTTEDGITELIRESATRAVERQTPPQRVPVPQDLDAAQEELRRLQAEIASLQQLRQAEEATNLILIELRERDRRGRRADLIRDLVFLTIGSGIGLAGNILTPQLAALIT